ncbi:hypothetical protein P0D88_33680 [Paraburkholderia sp. RL18-103-BIB-C]|jgi:hypothetical protein|uniref:hypothetical protein n=1 Tax=unclassified Paraburkholderia TaxID=2615204 RepID=UPI002E5B7E5F|nr:hypothetical protein [Paraburkholderia sp.]
MKIVVRIELITDWGDVNTIEVGRIDRPSQTLDQESVGLSLAPVQIGEASRLSSGFD